MPAADDRGFETAVFPAELEEIRQRRERLGLPPPDPEGGPDAGKELVGLALSGGGIRSASLSLGVVQVLASSGALPHVDYLSTVSGGGLLGSAVSSALNRPEASTTEDRFPFGFESGVPDRSAVRYLRNHDRYLAPGGLLDAIRLPANVIRGVLDNLAMLVPVLVGAVIATEWIFAAAYIWGLDRLRMVPVAVVSLFVALSLLQPVLYRRFARIYNWDRRNRLGNLLSGSMLAAATALLAVPLFFVVQSAIDLTWAEVRAYIDAHLHAIWLSLAGFIVLTIAGITAARRWKVVGTITLLLVGLSGFAAVFALYFLLTLYQVESPLLDPSLRSDLATGQVTPRVAAALEAKGFDADIGGPVERHERGRYVWWTVPSGDRTETIVDWRGNLRLVNVLFWDGFGEWIFYGAGLLGLIYAVWLTNPNATSQHPFFRDRLSRAFVFSIDPDGRVKNEVDLKLSRLNGEGTVAPYHLVNTTLNLQGSTALDLAGRQCDFFVFSKHWSGGPTTGYCRTHALERYDPQLTLGTAMAISGAGLAPNMGTETVRPLVFLFTLLNLRLDYWLPNPETVNRLSASRFGVLGPLGPSALLQEAFGRMTAGGRYVNVSDGGHLENLAVYELLRRRCRYIIAVDASEDPTMTFDCLVALLRFARIDLGISIAIDVDPLRPGADGLTAAHWVAGRIDYGAGQTGRLIYIKSSLTGDEPEAIRAYRRQCPSFPQESSANQFFTEAQFEAYRALGEHIADDVMRSPAAAAMTGQRQKVARNPS
jgi:predicted acylesterase/phospholipase RssA